MVETGRVAVVRFVARIAEGAEAGVIFATTDADVARAEGIYRDGREYEPLVFLVGEGMVPEGIDEATLEMSVGETRTVRVESEKAFGDYEDDRVVTMPRDELDERSDIDAEEGELVRSEAGATGEITAVTDETIEIDFNHELAGESVEFELRVLDVRDGRDAESEDE